VAESDGAVVGVGRLLVEDALSALAGAGYADCLLWVANQNAHARGFYQHLGFRSDGGRDVWRGLRSSAIAGSYRPRRPEPGRSGRARQRRLCPPLLHDEFEPGDMALQGTGITWIRSKAHRSCR
jgi:hypothetical protein